MGELKSALWGIGISALVFAAPAAAQDSVEDFYANTTIEMIIGYSPGGGYDQYARLVASHLGRFLPGNPDIIPLNMPGAGGRLAANHIFERASQDGSVIGIAEQTLAMAQAMGDPMLGNIDASAFGYIGSPARENNVFITWHESGVATLEDAKTTPIAIGATGSTSSTALPRLMNELLGTQFEIIQGYPGGGEIEFAMESGEVDGRAGANWASPKPRIWYDEGLIHIIAQIGLDSEPGLEDVPLLIDFAETEDDRALLHLYSASSAMGRPFFTPPNVPEERLQALRDAFDQMVTDPEFLAVAESQNLRIRASSGEELATVVDDILAAPPHIGQRLGELTGVGE